MSTQTKTRAQRRQARERSPAGTPPPGESRWVVPALAAVFLLSGAAGLVHEVVWARLLAHVFGASTLAVSTVLAAYMGGLALGSYWIGSRIERVRDRRRVYALLEIGIGIFALLVPLLLDVAEPLYGAMWRRFHFSFAVFSLLRFAIAGALLLAPTMMMGATLPVLADYLASLRDRPLAPQWLYTANLVGAVFGVAAAGFFLMPAVGVWGTILTGSAINVGVGIAVLALPRLAERAGELQTHAAHAREEPERSGARQLLLVAALFSGFLSLATQVAWTRVLVLVVGSNTYAFSTVLLVYLTALVAGSAWAARRGSGMRDVAPALALAHVLAALGTLAAVAGVDRLPYGYVSLFKVWRPETVGGLVALDAVVAFAILLPSILFAGTILPLALIGALARDTRGTGAVVGRVYALNTIGAILGAVLAGFVFVPVFGSERTLLGAAIAAAVLGAVFALRAPSRPALRAGVLASSVLVAVAALALPRWQPQGLNSAVSETVRFENEADIFVDADVLYYREGPTASVMVIRYEGERSIRINGRVNASDGKEDMPTQVLLAQVPIALAPRTDDVFVIGWGSGITVGSALRAPVKQVTAVELEPAVVEASSFFNDLSYDPRSDPRLRLYQDDARHILLASEDTYDVIISEPSHPWVAGVASLFTRDFFQLAASRLRDDGIFAQWLQGYQTSRETYRSVLASFLSVFPEVVVYAPSTAASYILIGSRRPIRFDVEELERRWAHAGTRSEMERVGVVRPEHLVAGAFIGPERVRALTRGVPLNTDDNMHVEFRAPLDMLGLESTASMDAYLYENITAVEEVLVDPGSFMKDPERVRALIEGRHRLGITAEEYEDLLARLEAAAQ